MGNNYKTEQYLNKHFLTPKQLKLFKYIKNTKKKMNICLHLERCVNT